MQVHVFVPRHSGVLHGQLLVAPVTPKAILPQALQRNWRFYGTLDSRSTLFDGVAVELHLQHKGYVVVDTKLSPVWS